MGQSCAAVLWKPSENSNSNKKKTKEKAVKKTKNIVKELLEEIWVEWKIAYDRRQWNKIVLLVKRLNDSKKEQKKKKKQLYFIINKFDDAVERPDNTLIPVTPKLWL